MKKDCENVKGFTLVELMIVVAIIGILAAIAIPDFMKYQAKSKQVEAKSNLGAIYVSQISYYGVHATYAGGSTAFELLGWEPMTTYVARYSYIIDQSIIEPASNPVISPAGIPVSRESFTAIAAGNIDNDPMIDIWGINNSKVLRNNIPGADSWGAYTNDAAID